MLSSVSVGAPLNSTIEVAGPEQFRADALARRRLMARHDPRQVVVDRRARFFGAEVDDRSLLPGADARLADTRFEDWYPPATGAKYGNGLLRSRTHELTAEPVLESGLANGGVVVGHERAFSKLRSIIARVWIHDHGTSIVTRG